jgi:hypothetical protein
VPLNTRDFLDVFDNSKLIDKHLIVEVELFEETCQEFKNFARFLESVLVSLLFKLEDFV